MLGLGRSLGLSVGSIYSSKLRSSLTTLGIIIGVAAVIANVTLGASFNQYFTEEIGAIGSNFIVVTSHNPNVFFDRHTGMIGTVPGVVGVSPIKQQMAKVTYLSTSRQVDIQGVNQDYDEVANLEVEYGDFLSATDKYVAVLGAKVAKEKFGTTVSVRNPVIITFRLEDGGTISRKFIVKGVLKDANITFAHSGVESSTRIFIPIDTMKEMLGSEYYNGFFIKAESLEAIEATGNEIDRQLARSFGVSNRDMDNDDAKPYVLIDQIGLLKQVDQLSMALTALLTSVALISLIVGSIGIMNIMLVTVAERTQEIGLMKALGFTKSDIRMLFIIESMIVGLLGGVLGLVIGIAVSLLVNSYLGLPNIFPILQIFIGFAVAVTVGLIAGVYPASKAAKMDPVEALRKE